jgi:hypothetical protein
MEATAMAEVSKQRTSMPAPAPIFGRLPPDLRARWGPFVSVEEDADWIFGQFRLSCFLGKTPWGEPSVSDRTIRRLVSNRGLPQYRGSRECTRGIGGACFAVNQVLWWGVNGNWRFPNEAQIKSLLSASVR